MVFPFFFLFLNGILLHLLRFVSWDKHAVIRLDREENVEDKRETRFCYASSFWLIYRLWRRSHTRASTSHHWDIINFNTALSRTPTARPLPCHSLNLIASRYTTTRYNLNYFRPCYSFLQIFVSLEQDKSLSNCSLSDKDLVIETGETVGYVSVASIKIFCINIRGLVIS